MSHTLHYAKPNWQLTADHVEIDSPEKYLRVAAVQANVWFSTCDNTDSATFEEDKKFEVCQAGYKDRKLVFDNEKK